MFISKNYLLLMVIVITLLQNLSFNLGVNSFLKVGNDFKQTNEDKISLNLSIEFLLSKRTVLHQSRPILNKTPLLAYRSTSNATNILKFHDATTGRSVVIL